MKIIKKIQFKISLIALLCSMNAIVMGIPVAPSNLPANANYQ